VSLSLSVTLEYPQDSKIRRLQILVADLNRLFYFYGTARRNGLACQGRTAQGRGFIGTNGELMEYAKKKYPINGCPSLRQFGKIFVLVQSASARVETASVGPVLIEDWRQTKKLHGFPRFYGFIFCEINATRGVFAILFSPGFRNPGIERRLSFPLIPYPES
jgi:hypothetical protein